MPGLRARDGAALIALAAGLGAVLGVAWWWIAPRVVLDVYGDQAYPAEYQPGGYIADEGWAAIAGILGGVAMILIAGWASRRRQGHWLDMSVLGWSVLAGLVGAVAIWIVGEGLGSVDVEAAIAAAGDGGSFEAPLRLRMPGVLLLWPLASAVVFTGVSIVAWITDRAHSPSS